MTQITSVRIDPKYIKEGTEVVICSSGSSFHGLTGHICEIVNADSPYIPILFDERSREILKANGLGTKADTSVPFNPRELCVAENDPDEEDYTCDCDRPHCSTCNSHMRGPNCPNCDHPANF